MAYLDNKKTLKYTHKIVFGLVDDPGTHDYITYDEMSEELAAYALKTEVPSKTSDLTNDTHFVTRNEMDVAIGAILDDVAFEEDIPVNLSELNNDEGFITLSDIPTIPTKTSDLTNDSGFITLSDVPTIPTKTSDLTNDSNFITLSDIPAIPTKTSDLTNDSGFLTTAVTSFNGSTGAVTYTAPVTSVNGQTGVVSIDTGVTSFNGSTGAVTYTAPVTSVNGQTGAVTVDAGGVEVYTVDRDDVAYYHNHLDTAFQTIESYYTAVNSGDIDCKLYLLRDGNRYEEVIDISKEYSEGVEYNYSLYRLSSLFSKLEIGAYDYGEGNIEYFANNYNQPYNPTYPHVRFVSGDHLDADTMDSNDWYPVQYYYNTCQYDYQDLSYKLYIVWNSGVKEEVISIQGDSVEIDGTTYLRFTILTIHYKYVIGSDLNNEYVVFSKSTVCPTFTYDSTTNSLDITLI